MRLDYYPETDSLYVELRAGPGAETREVSDGLNVDFDLIGFDIDHASKRLDLSTLETAAGNVIGFDIDHASKRLDLSTLETEALPVHSARVS